MDKPDNTSPPHRLSSPASYIDSATRARIKASGNEIQLAEAQTDALIAIALLLYGQRKDALRLEQGWDIP